MIKLGVVGLGKMGLSHFSIANAHPQTAGRFADVWLTQWPHLAAPGSPEAERSGTGPARHPEYWGAVL